MKCPKCGFNSFEYYDQCTKCSGDLTAYKQSYSITSLVLPLEAKINLAAKFGAPEHESDTSSDTEGTHGDMFSFDLPDESSFTADAAQSDPFGFGESTSGTGDSTAMDEDPFANLLESTSQGDSSPFESAQSPASSIPVAVDAPSVTSEPGEFDLDSFSWGDTPDVASSEQEASSESVAPEDFDSLFGNTDENSKK